MKDPQYFFEQLKRAQLRNKQKTSSAVTTTSAKQLKPKITDEQYCKLITDKALLRIKQLPLS